MGDNNPLVQTWALGGSFHLPRRIATPGHQHRDPSKLVRLRSGLYQNRMRSILDIFAWGNKKRYPYIILCGRRGVKKWMMINENKKYIDDEMLYGRPFRLPWPICIVIFNFVLIKQSHAINFHNLKTVNSLVELVKDVLKAYLTPLSLVYSRLFQMVSKL